MILLVTSAPRAQECAHALQQATGEPVTIATNFSNALTHLRAATFSLGIFDRNALENEPHEIAKVWAHLELTPVVEINLALISLERLVREVQSALDLCRHNQSTARANAIRALQGEVNQTLTELLLDCDLTIQLGDLPPAAHERVTLIRAHAQKLCQQIAPACAN